MNSTNSHDLTINWWNGRRHPGRALKALFMVIVLFALLAWITGCGSGGSSVPAVPSPAEPTTTTTTNPTTDPTTNPTTNPTPGPVVTPIATAPTGLPALTGLSTGFNVALSAGMAAPAAPGALAAPVPQATGGTIIDQDAAIRLGKALFWDMQAGSDGQIACASCHFQAGADNRTTNTINPGSNALFNVVPAAGSIFNFVTFNPLVADDVVGSSGVISKTFSAISTDLNDPVDVCIPVVPADPGQAAISNAGQRLVTGRNTPPAVGAAYYLDNFWDGRASNNFNGLNPLGAGVVVAGTSSLASQAVGPPLSDVEMSCAGRTWNGPNSLGAKLVPRVPLAKQLVDPTDSVLGPLSNAPANGLSCGFSDRLCTYADLIAAAFGTHGLTGQAAMDFYIDNFSSIWGQAVQAYEATLVPDRTPYDLGTLTAAQLNGLTAFRTRGCAACHVEPEFSDATVRMINQNGGPTQPKLIGGQPAGDQGFHNIGSAATAQDLGRAASPGGVYNLPAGAVDFNRGAFKTPGLRNVKLTAPYMHNGSIATIPDVILFYNGNGQVANAEFDPAARVNINGGNRAAVADFLLNGLTDCRVEHNRAPFDHPSLVIPNGPTLTAIGRGGDGTVCP